MSGALGGNYCFTNGIERKYGKQPKMRKNLEKMEQKWKKRINEVMQKTLSQYTRRKADGKEGSGMDREMRTRILIRGLEGKLK